MKYTIEDIVLSFEFDFLCDFTQERIQSLFKKELSVTIKTFNSYIDYDTNKSNNEDNVNILYIPVDGAIRKLTTPFLPYKKTFALLIKILDLLSSICTTNDQCSLIVNIKYDDSKFGGDFLKHLDILKFISFFDEEKIFKLFPNRRGFYSCRSIKKVYPYDLNVKVPSVESILDYSYKLPFGDFYGVDFKSVYSNYVSFKYIGGKQYETKSKDIITLIDYFAKFTFDVCTNAIEFNSEGKQKLADIHNRFYQTYIACQDYELFKKRFPKIKLMYDLKIRPVFIKTMISLYSERIAAFLVDTNFRNGILNYDSTIDKFEIRNATIKNGGIFNDVHVITSKIEKGIFVRCDIKQSELSKTRIQNSNIYNSKIETALLYDSFTDSKCKINNSEVKGDMSFISGQIFNSIIYSGRFGANNKTLVSSNNVIINLKENDSVKNIKKERHDFRSFY